MARKNNATDTAADQLAAIEEQVLALFQSADALLNDVQRTGEPLTGYRRLRTIWHVTRRLAAYQRERPNQFDNDTPPANPFVFGTATAQPIVNDTPPDIFGTGAFNSPIEVEGVDNPPAPNLFQSVKDDKPVERKRKEKKEPQEEGHRVVLASSENTMDD